MAFHRNFEGVEWLVFFRTSRSSYWNIPSSVESVHILFMPFSDSLAVVSLLHAFHWDFLPQFWKFVVRTLSLEKSISATSVLQVVPADLSTNLSNPTSTGDTEASLLFILQTRWLCRLCIKIAFLRVQMSTASVRCLLEFSSTGGSSTAVGLRPFVPRVFGTKLRSNILNHALPFFVDKLSVSLLILSFIQKWWLHISYIGYGNICNMICFWSTVKCCLEFVSQQASPQASGSTSRNQWLQSRRIRTENSSGSPWVISQSS